MKAKAICLAACCAGLLALLGACAAKKQNPTRDVSVQPRIVEKNSAIPSAKPWPSVTPDAPLPSATPVTNEIEPLKTFAPLPRDLPPNGQPAAAKADMLAGGIAYGADYESLIRVFGIPAASQEHVEDATGDVLRMIAYSNGNVFVFRKSDEQGGFRLDEAEIFEAGVPGPRGLCVSSPLDDVLAAFCVDPPRWTDEQTRTIGEYWMDNAYMYTRVFTYNGGTPQAETVVLEPQGTIEFDGGTMVVRYNFPERDYSEAEILDYSYLFHWHGTIWFVIENDVVISYGFGVYAAE